MNSTSLKSKPNLQYLPLILFFFFGIVHFYQFASHIFFYQEKSSLFQHTLPYLFEHLSQPGGFLVYLGKLQSAFYYYPLLGAILVSFEICALILLIAKIGTLISKKNRQFFPYLIGAILFYLQTNYRFSTENILGLVVVFVLLRLILKSQTRINSWTAVASFPISYYLLGSFSYLYIVVLTILLIQNKKWIPLGISLSLLGLFFFIGKEFLFFQTTDTLLIYPVSFESIGNQVSIFSVLVALVLLTPFWSRISPPMIDAFSIKSFKIIEFVPYVLLFALIIISVQRIDKKREHYFYVEKLFYEQNYEELIQFNLKNRPTNMLSVFLNNIALNEEGILSNSMLSFPQASNGNTLFLKWEITKEILKRGGYYYYNLGMINEAQRWAYEYMVMQGSTPETVKMIIKTELIKGNNESAYKYINILNNTIFYRKEAKEFADLLYNDEAINNHHELGAKKALMPNEDFFVMADAPDANLDLILQTDSVSTKALEYKLAALLLKKEMAGIIKMLPLLEKAGYTKIPKNVEEVVVAFMFLKMGEMPPLEKLKINPETEQQFQQFNRIFRQNQQNKQMAQRALAPDFADTYWYYVFFN